jgi:hypothetical protein
VAEQVEWQRGDPGRELLRIDLTALDGALDSTNG